MRTESWCGHEIRFVEVNGEWYAILKDICDALGLRSKDISQILDPDMLERVCVETSEDGSNGLRSRGDNKTRWMLAIHEIDIYKALFASGQLEARKFRRWSATVLQKLRNQVGLEQYEVMRMTEPEIQEDIDHILDTLFYDEEEEKNMLKKEKPGYHESKVIEPLVLEAGDYKNEPEKWNTIKELFGFSSTDKVSIIRAHISTVAYFVEN